MHLNWSAILNPLFSLFDEEVRQFMARHAGSIPEDSWLKTERFRRTFDVVRGALEKGFRLDNKVFETVKEKLVDYGDYFTSAVSGTGRVAGAQPKGPGPAIDKRMEEFFNEARKRIRESPDPEAEFERVIVEFELLKVLLRQFEEVIESASEEARKKSGAKRASVPEGLKRPWVDWGKIQEQFEVFREWSGFQVAEIVNLVEETDRQVARQLHRFGDWMRGR
ncbi:MAG: hypothetical protein HYS78_01070 [Parcubacteria group bacterium]|nr:hypothetical protein [Parcubacteria group bacterium]